MLMSLVPVFNRHVARQFVFSAAVNCVEMVLIVGYLSQWPVIMTLVVFALYVMRFRFMSGAAVSAGVDGVVCQSTMLNFMSYPTSNWHTLMFSNMEACVLAVALSALLHYLIPDVEPRKPPPRIEKTPPASATSRCSPARWRRSSSWCFRSAISATRCRR